MVNDILILDPDFDIIYLENNIDLVYTRIKEGWMEISKNFLVRPLGDDGWRQIIESALPNYVKKLPSMVRKNLPAIWNNGEIVDMPLFSGHNTALGIAKGRFEMVFIPKMKHQKLNVLLVGQTFNLK